MPNISRLISPYGGRLVNQIIADDERQVLLERARRLPSIQLSSRSLCDLELLATGGFSPLVGFMGKADYERVIEEMRLSNGTLFPIPITLPVSGQGIVIGKEIALRSPKNDLLAVMTVEEAYEWNLEAEANQVCGTTDSRHPLVAEMHSWPKIYISGPLAVLSLPKRYDFGELRRSPAQVRSLLSEMGHSNVVAFQTRNPIHWSALPNPVMSIILRGFELTRFWWINITTSRERSSVSFPSRCGWRDREKLCGTLLFGETTAPITLSSGEITPGLGMTPKAFLFTALTMRRNVCSSTRTKSA
jgi:hypothetical protein